ncbi:hypothetical protein, partial [Vibrio thalassae]
DDVFAIAPAAMNATGSGIEQQYRSALIGLSVLGGGEALANVVSDLATDLADNTLDVNTAKALYLNTQTWLRRHGMTDLALNVPTYGLDSAAQQAVDTTLANDTTLAYFPEILQTSTGTLDLTALLSGYLPAGSSVSVSVLDGGNLTDVTGTFDTSLYTSGAQIQISVDVDGIARLETITLQPSATPVSVTSTLSDINNGSHTFTVTASDSQSVTIESFTPEVATIANNQISVNQDGTARFAVTANDGSWQEVVSLDVLSPRTAPSINWSLNTSGDLQVASINGDATNVSVNYQGSDSSLTMMTVLPVDRNASDSISWMVEKDGVRYSAVESVEVADVVNPLAINNLTARVADTSISDADLLAEFMGLLDVATDATTLGLYRIELASNPVSSISVLQALITEQNAAAIALIDLQNTASSNITITQLQTLLPNQHLLTNLLGDYQTALENGTWNTPDEVQALIVGVNAYVIDSDGDGILDANDPEPYVWNDLATGERFGETQVSSTHTQTEYTTPVLRIMTQAHTRSEDMYVPLEDYPDSLKRWDSNYMPRVAFSAVSNGTKDGAVWQDQTNMAVYYSEFNPDGTHNRTLSLPNDDNERLLSATSNGSGAIVYGLSKSREEYETALTMPVRLIRYDLNNETITISKLLDSSTPTGALPDGLDVSNVGSTPSKLAWSGDRIGLNLLRSRTDGHQSGVAVVYDANTLDLVKNHLQISGHQFG